MTNDNKATVIGAVGGIPLIVNWLLGVFHLPTAPPEVQAAFVGLIVVILGYYTNKADKPKGGT